jgi:hypothetical protein
MIARAVAACKNQASAYLAAVFVAIAAQAPASSAVADIFGSGANTFEIEFVPIGSPGNPLDDDPNP